MIHHSSKGLALDAVTVKRLELQRREDASTRKGSHRRLVIFYQTRSFLIGRSCHAVL